MSGVNHAKHALPKGKTKISAGKIVLIVVSSLLLVMMVSAGFVLHALRNPSSLFTQPVLVAASQTPIATNAPTIDAQVAGVAATPEAVITPEPTPDYTFDKNRVNILLLGSDSSVERVQAGMNSRTDSMILLSIDLQSNEMSMISIPRDSYVRVNGGDQRTKINAAFVYGGGAKKDGYQYAMDTVTWTLGGIRVDYYIGFGMQVVKDVANAMGGIDYDVDIAFTMNGRKTEKGMQHMDGQQILDYCRYRGTGRGDIDRIDRQQRVLFSMFQQMKNTDQIKNIPSIFEAVMSQINTNLNLVQIASLAYWARNLDMDDISRNTLEGNGLYIGKTSYWVLNQEKKKALVKEIFGVDIVIPAGEDYTSIKSMAQELGMKVSEVMQLIDPLRQGIYNGTITDPAILQAVGIGEAALMTEKKSEIESALTALRPYASYAVQSTPTPSTGLGGVDVPTITGDDTQLGGTADSGSGGMLGGN